MDEGRAFQFVGASVKAKGTQQTPGSFCTPARNSLFARRERLGVSFSCFLASRRVFNECFGSVASHCVCHYI